jgi:tetratricopeptide (TPR) repeat protein
MASNFDTAVLAFRAGNLREAELACRRALAEQPTNPAALNLLGIIGGCIGRDKEAAELMGRAVEIAPQVDEYRRNLARALLKQKRWNDARNVLRPAIERNPDSPELQGLWGMVVGRMGKLEEGIKALQKAIELSPAEPLYHFNLSELHRMEGNQESAIASLEATLKLKPDHADALNNLAGLQLASGEFLAALGSVQQLLAINPRSVQAYSNLSVLLAAAGDSSAAVTALRNAATLDPSSARTRFLLANQLISAGKLDEADGLIRELRADPSTDSLSLKLTHIRILERRGDISGAVEILKTMDDSTQPELASYPEVAITRALVEEQQGNLDEAAQTLERVLETNDYAAVEGIGIQFALGQIYDGLGRYEEAFDAYQRGNENRKKAFFKFNDAERDPAAVADRLIGCYDPETYLACPESELSSDVPIFIIGMPRSGTSLLEQILASHPEVFGAGELSTFRDMVRNTYEGPGKTAPEGPLRIIDTDPSIHHQCMIPSSWPGTTSDQLSAIGRGYLDYVDEVSAGSPRVTDKMPYNYYLVPIIRKVFPNAKIIHACRHPLDTCLSCYFQNFTAGSQYAFELTDLGEFYRAYLRLMRYWRDTLDVSLFEIDYEELVLNPETHVQRLLDYCDLPWDPACLNFHRSKRIVSTASYQQVRRPMYSSSVGRWKNYEAQLAPLIEVLSDDLMQVAN